MWGRLLDAPHGKECGLDVDTLCVHRLNSARNESRVWDTDGCVSKLELERGMSGIGCEGLEGFFGHTNDHGVLR